MTLLYNIFDHFLALLLLSKGIFRWIWNVAHLCFLGALKQDLWWRRHKGGNQHHLLGQPYHLLHHPRSSSMHCNAKYERDNISIYDINDMIIKRLIWSICIKIKILDRCKLLWSPSPKKKKCCYEVYTGVADFSFWVNTNLE